MMGERPWPKDDKPRIRVPSQEYNLWVYGLYHNNKDWDSDAPIYKGLYHHTKNSLNQIYNTSLSELINKAP